MSIVFLNVPYSEKDDAKALGAKWDLINKKWYIDSNIGCGVFRKWLPEDTLVQSERKTGQEVLLQEEGVSLFQYLSKIAEAVKQKTPNPEWIRAEVGEIKRKDYCCYLDLVDSNQKGEQISKCHAIIWQGKIEKIFEKFKEQTGSDIQKGIKILLYGKAELNVLYGLSIRIEDIDPNYTIGDLLANLKALRKKLQDEKIYQKNKQLPEPYDFTEIAVISPDKAAGLGDFKKEADILTSYGLCKFTYYSALFQGNATGEEISTQIQKVMEDNKYKQYDALVIIRGGGAVTDLAWLNNYAIATAICCSEIPVFTGIGHERDETILDEISCRSFDTPSKVIKHIWTTIETNATKAQKDRNDIFERAQALADKAQKAIDPLFASCLREATHKIEAQRRQLFQSMNSILVSANYGVQRAGDYVKHEFHTILTVSDNVIEKLVSKIEVIYHGKIILLAGHLVGEYQKKLLDNARLISERATHAVKTLERTFIHLRQIIDLASPLKILQRGFALVRSESNAILTSKSAAVQSFNGEQALKLIFHDGDLLITNIKQDTK